jgi:hypothetical protein
MFGIKSSAIALLALSGWMLAQDPPKPPSEIKTGEMETLLAKALAHSPDVQVAEAKVREAEAELRRTRLTLLQKVLEARATLETNRVNVLQAERSLLRIGELMRKGAGSSDEVSRAEGELMRAKAQSAAAEASFNAIIGATPAGADFVNLAGARRGDPGPGISASPSDNLPEHPRRAPHPGMAEKIRQALDTPVKTVSFDGSPLKDVIDYYHEQIKHVPIVGAVGGYAENQVNLKLSKELPLGAHFQALQDVAPGMVICVRDYGFLITFDQVPNDAMTYLDFWHAKPKTDAK